MSGAEDTTVGAFAPAERSRWGSLDLPGVLPIMLVAATWEFLLKRVVGIAAGDAPPGTLQQLLSILTAIGTFSENAAFLLALVLFAEAIVNLMRNAGLGPIPHRITICGFACTVVVVTSIGWLFSIGSDTALLAHAAAVLLSLLLCLGLLWHRVKLRLLMGVFTFLLPTVLRFYASCSISLPMLHTESPAPLYIYRSAEVMAVLAAFASPWLLAGLTFKSFIRRPPLIAMGLASLPALALAAALTGPNDHVRELCLGAVGFELLLPPVEVVYPLALFFFLLSVATLILPGLGSPRSHSDQRLGYGIALLFIVGLDALWGPVAGLGVEVDNVPELTLFLLEGNWSDLTTAQQMLIGPPIRDLYQLLLLSFGYVLLARGVLGQRKAGGTGDPSSENGSEVS